MLQAHQIRPSNSPWPSPVIIHKKKDGGIRFLVDYRKLNAVTKKDCFPQPTTEELLNRLGSRKFYTKLDLKSDGLWEFNVLPQGITNGPPTFQRTMHNLIGYGRWDYVIVYLDDILLFSTTFDEYVQHVNEILSVLDKANFQVNPDKCNIAVREVNFLSHITNEKLIKPNEYPDVSTPFVLTTDASEIGIGGILRQDITTGTTINYFKSRVLDDTERKYDTIEREALAIYWCLTDLRSYIGDSGIVIKTNHEPLPNFHKKQINNKRIMNWIFKLQDILPQIIAVKYRNGSNNIAADYISRPFPSSNVINNSTILAEQTDDWSVGTEQWFEDLPKPQRLRFATSFINTTNSTINAVTTRAKAKLIAQSVPPASAEPSTTTP
ncbi:unnamed protein product [Rotaria socialis]|uniref:Reverse transcriptase domain-containing protein n=1 Tax=Rotaria socialis TaxID=392032 RepID=A0A817QW87_9BILA|nr:unnamed protein product [Rotaria socialis]